uniref:Apple domain-containing protein n=1 Tax=Caenorhabditis tropicalis TaxID=1561998 RepID=A0A1I7UWL1_9PELO
MKTLLSFLLLLLAFIGFVKSVAMLSSYQYYVTDNVPAVVFRGTIPKVVSTDPVNFCRRQCEVNTNCVAGYAVNSTGVCRLYSLDVTVDLVPYPGAKTTGERDLFLILKVDMKTDGFHQMIHSIPDKRRKFRYIMSDNLIQVRETKL